MSGHSGMLQSVDFVWKIPKQTAKNSQCISLCIHEIPLDISRILKILLAYRQRREPEFAV